MPYTRKEIIASRYLGALVYMVLTIIVTSLALFVSFTFPLFYIFKPGYITTVVLISFILLAGAVPPIVLFLAEHLTEITDFIVSLSIPALYIGTAVVIVILYAISWETTTIIYQRKIF